MSGQATRPRPRIITVRLGRRSIFLLLFGLVYGVYGVATYLSPAPTNVWVAQWVPSLGFTVAGLIALFSALAHPRLEWFGFTTLYVVAGGWAAQYLAGWVYGIPRAWAGFIVWSLLVAIILLIAGWPEPPPRDVIQHMMDGNGNGHGHDTSHDPHGEV